MAQRPGFTVSKVVGVNGGRSPNAYVGKVTVEIRVHYPALQIGKAIDVLAEAMEEADAEMRKRALAALAQGLSIEEE